MLPVLAMMAVLWGVGVVTKAPLRLRLTMIGALWAAVVLLHLALPDNHPLRQATGGDARGWLALGVVVALITGYRIVLGRMQARATPPPVRAPTGRFTPAELDRYARHITLREIGGTGQRRLHDARVLVIGAGGLGSPLLLYLAAAGVGRIGVIDDDVVENANLARQIIHADARIGMPKVFSAEIAMKALNPFIEVRPWNRRLTEDNAQDLFAEHDLILDGSDNFDTRYLVNRVAVAAGIPLIAAAITQWEGQVSLYHPAAGGPCFACIFPNRPALGLVPTCAEAGVAGPLPGVIGAMMALEAVKHLTGAGETLMGRLMIHDALYAETRVIMAHRNPDCAVCGTPPPT
jgi:molybdopterin/thiamine biosynthesis adenylyltransferase